MPRTKRKRAVLHQKQSNTMKLIAMHQKKNQFLLPSLDMSGEIREVYAVVDNTKKIYKSGPLPSQQLHQEASLTDLYAVVGKSKKLNNSLPSQQLYRESVTERANREIQKTCCKYPVLVTSCLTVVIAAVVVAALAVVIALALIAGLHSELDSVIENHKLDHNNFKQKLHQLQTEYYSFSSYTSDLLVGVRQSTSESASNLRQQTNITHGLIRSFGDGISLIRTNMQVLNTTLIQKI